jgi:hypothetical protein
MGEHQTFPFLLPRPEKHSLHSGVACCKPYLRPAAASLRGCIMNGSHRKISFPFLSLSSYGNTLSTLSMLQLFVSSIYCTEMAATVTRNQDDDTISVGNLPDINTDINTDIAVAPP